ncbi:MAG: asparaginase [Gemmatimonadota bacterium]
MTECGTVDVLRGGLIESRHAFHAVVADGSGRSLMTLGSASVPTFTRSAIKPLQASAVAADGAFDAFDMGSDMVALACASHGGEEDHVALARAMLSRVGASVEDLACGPHEPMYAPAARALAGSGTAPGRLHNNCSGKHAAMLALAAHLGTGLEGYHRADHPVQRRMGEELCRWAGLDADALETGVDGCGAATFRVPLAALAIAFARWSVAEGPPARVRAAIASHPRLLAGTGRLCTAIVRETRGSVLAKVGAEGVYCACVPERGLGVALKVGDGARRAAEAALVALLEAHGALGADQAARLGAAAAPPVLNTRGETVGGVVVRMPAGVGAP